ncbi:hypothetical protein BDY19DRAFT_905111 [Irpex rosettiformis]|uniref:Uncharacterized protein n=1 Tax=Irpex rosettiformis TaxID=378272 RepID=A0ACB8U9E8_9APHY|nr:hypothetical protein BDY19DRAFT_905111 [Irpex rosettiformis]
MSDNSSSSSSDEKKGPHRYTLLVDKLPHISILIPKNPELPLGTEASERCFMYCSQSLRGRASHEEPWCRTICIRKVFKPELRGTIIATGQEIDVKIPLPPEGQKGAHFMKSFFGLKPSQDGDKDGDSDWTAIANNPNLKDVETWRPGWYLYMSKRFVPAVTEIGSMEDTLWKTQRGRMAKTGYLKKYSKKSLKEVVEKEPDLLPNLEEDITRSLESEGSIIIPLPPPFPTVSESMKKMFEPTFKILTQTHESITSGRQMQLAERLWEKAQTRDPFILARNVVQKAWKTWQNVEDDDDDNTGRRPPP